MLHPQHPVTVLKDLIVICRFLWRKDIVVMTTSSVISNEKKGVQGQW